MKEAFPELSRAVCVWATPSTEKIRLPLGAGPPPLLPVTRAVNVTDCPTCDEPAEVSVTVLVSLTSWVTVEAFGKKLPSPP